MDNRSPLANQLRPKNLSEFYGQNKVLGLNSIVNSCIHSKRLCNLILWGPPGTGKTSLALLLGQEFEAEFIALNAVEVGSKLLRDIGEKSRFRFRLDSRQTILFVDEIHRLNKSQQDILLPFIEQGDFVLIGATTENPSYELNRALMSRCHLLVFEELTFEDLEKIWMKACVLLKRELNWITESALNQLFIIGDGDARRFINLIELLAVYSEQNLNHFPIDIEHLQKVLPKQSLNYDKGAESHYDTISAFIKSIRGSDANAGLYYLARMIESGEDPIFIARRLVILASEDIGNADPRALQLSIAGFEAVKIIGLPECGINLAQVVTYLASAPKSNRSYLGWKKALDFVRKNQNLPIPLHLRSSKTTLMAQLGYGKSYKYPHDNPKGWVEQNYFPEFLHNESFYEPSDLGFEKNIKDYSLWLKNKKNK